MKKILLIVASLVLIFYLAKISHAQIKQDEYYDYVIPEFKSQIEIQKDTSLLVVETIVLNFPQPRHGIYRVIPITYTANGKTIKAGFSLDSITDENGVGLQYEKSRRGQSVSLKIGDPDLTIQGLHTYVIKYKITKVLQRFDTHDELYWNVTGSEWDTDILKAQAFVTSEFAPVAKVECFAGEFGSTERFCTGNNTTSEALFTSSTTLGSGRDFTIVVALDKNNSLVFPSRTKTMLSNILDNWGYFISPTPFLLILLFWYKKGRDKKYAGENIYYKPDKPKEITKPLFSREFLPTVYHPIQQLTPSQLGTIVDEKVDMHDLVAEIVELARMGYLKIEKIEKDKFIGKETDYALTKLKEDIKGLNDYQTYLLEKLFDDKVVAKTIIEIEKKYKANESLMKDLLKLANEDKYVLLSALKNNFYTHLEDFKKKLYESLVTKALFVESPDKTRIKWISYFIAMDVLAAILLFRFLDLSANVFPILVLAIFSVPSFFLAFNMPRKTAWGYSLYRQAKGLAYYLKKGKWRYEVNEKHLFFEEMVPLAISLGVLDKLAKDMEGLGVKPPSYFGGVTAATLASDISGFESRASSSLVSAPGGKGSSSWSGGSGFSGGSGGGFGGGGGGSW